MSSFSSMAFCLAIIGVFGMISYSVAQRSHEISIRVALGAQPGEILRQFLRHGLSCIFAGLALGFSGAWLLTRLLKTLLFGVDSLDGRIFLLVAAVYCGAGSVLASRWARNPGRCDHRSSLPMRHGPLAHKRTMKMDCSAPLPSINRRKANVVEL
jgi:ABC-type antimicrobial peptide transport system permease subunit